MDENFLLMSAVTDLKKNLYLVAQEISSLILAAHPYAKDDENLRQAIDRVRQMLGKKI